MVLIEIPNSRLKQYYYDVIKELHDVKLSDMTTTEDFYYNIQDCYERGLDINVCIDELIELQGENNEQHLRNFCYSLSSIYGRWVAY